MNDAAQMPEGYVLLWNDANNPEGWVSLPLTHPFYDSPIQGHDFLFEAPAPRVTYREVAERTQYMIRLIVKGDVIPGELVLDAAPFCAVCCNQPGPVTMQYASEVTGTGPVREYDACPECKGGRPLT